METLRSGVTRPARLSLGQPRRGQQAVPVVGRIAVRQHLREHTVRIGLAFVGALGGLVVDPAKDDDLLLRVEAVEKPVLLEEPRAAPVLCVSPSVPPSRYSAFAGSDGILFIINSKIAPSRFAAFFCR